MRSMTLFSKIGRATTVALGGLALCIGFMSTIPAASAQSARQEHQRQHHRNE